MKKLYKNIFYLVLMLASVSACQSVKDGLSGNKKSNSDEFLVKKKNPLVLPPEFDKLPAPQTSNKGIEINEEEFDLQKILTNKKSKKKTKLKSKVSKGSLEENILEKIKSN
tara:strand:- start:267 stop:599 length:333 start_codon:yes stop_codon:yes gene_type:complete